MAHFRLADPVNTPEALLKPVGIPRQVVIDHQVRPLQVDSLSGGVRSKKHLNVRVMPEGFLCLEAFFAFLATVDDCNGSFASEQRGDPAPEIMQRVEVLGENDDLLSRRCRLRIFRRLVQCSRRSAAAPCRFGSPAADRIVPAISCPRRFAQPGPRCFFQFLQRGYFGLQFLDGLGSRSHAEDFLFELLDLVVGSVFYRFVPGFPG